MRRSRWRRADEAGLAHQVSFRPGNCALSLPLDDGAADVVVDIESARHYSDRRRFLHEAARVLRAGGRLVATD